MYTPNTECHLYRKKGIREINAFVLLRKLLLELHRFLMEFTSVKLHYVETEISAPLYMWQD
jgi:hypothetical protein